VDIKIEKHHCQREHRQSQLAAGAAVASQILFCSVPKGTLGLCAGGTLGLNLSRSDLSGNVAMKITDATTETRETWENPEVVSCMVQNMLHMSKNDQTWF
jgi:hypothetical protein